MSDYQEYTIDGDGYQGNGDGYQGNGNGNGNGNGYDQLNGDYALFYKVGKRFAYKVKREDSEDFLHDLFLAFARVKTSYIAKDKELTEGGLMRVAKYEHATYLRKYYYKINGIDCGRCSKAQREKCKDWFLYPDCPKAVKMERLDRLVQDGNGNTTPLHELIADNKAVDVAARLDARLILESYPHRFVKLAYKKEVGYQLSEVERRYYNRERKKAQKRLV